MKRLPVVLAAVLVGLVVQPTASARPAPSLCSYDRTRGPVPADFVVDACVEDAAVTVRNSLAVPVLMRTGGDVGAPVRVRTSAGTAAALTRFAGEEGDVLMPGDVVRWPLGPGAAELIVTDADLRVPAAIVATLAPFLPRREGGGPDTLDQKAFGALVREIAPVVTTRAACVRDRNFLQRAACDVDASAAIAGALVDRLPVRVATELMTEVLDADQWLEWSSAARMAVGLPDSGRRRLVLGPRPVPTPAVPQPQTSVVSRTAAQPGSALPQALASAPLPVVPPAQPAASPAPPARPAGPGHGGNDNGGKKADHNRGHGKAHGDDKAHGHDKKGRD
jgi:hypothetical protein